MKFKEISLIQTKDRIQKIYSTIHVDMVKATQFGHQHLLFNNVEAAHYAGYILKCKVLLSALFWLNFLEIHFHLLLF